MGSSRTFDTMFSDNAKCHILKDMGIEPLVKLRSGITIFPGEIIRGCESCSDSSSSPIYIGFHSLKRTECFKHVGWMFQHGYLRMLFKPRSHNPSCVYRIIVLNKTKGCFARKQQGLDKGKENFVQDLDVFVGGEAPLAKPVSSLTPTAHIQPVQR